MLGLKRINLLQALKINRILSAFRENKNDLNFYSDFKGGILNYLLKGDVYSIMKDDNLSGFIIADRWQKIIYYIPIDNSISIFRLLHLLVKNFKTEDYSLSLIHKKIDLDNLKRFFSISIIENMMYMHFDNNLKSCSLALNSSLLVRNMIIGKDENIRLELQNKIFNNVENRSILTLDEILTEQINPRFLKDHCYIFEVYREPAGYGQILKFNNKFFLVNFGIISEYRNYGYGYYFLNNILRECSKAGINDLYLSVDKYNENAINLYKKIGFKEMYNLLTIKFNK